MSNQIIPCVFSPGASETSKRLMVAPANGPVFLWNPSQHALMLGSGSQTLVIAVSCPAPFPKASDREVAVWNINLI